MISSMDDEFRLPHDYQYDDGEPLDVVEPSVLLGKIPRWVVDDRNVLIRIVLGSPSQYDRQATTFV